MSEINSRVWIDDGIYIKELQEENARLRDALEWFKDHNNYAWPSGMITADRRPNVLIEGRMKARIALRIQEALKSPHDGKETR